MFNKQIKRRLDDQRDWLNSLTNDARELKQLVYKTNTSMDTRFSITSEHSKNLRQLVDEIDEEVGELDKQQDLITSDLIDQQEQINAILNYLKIDLIEKPFECEEYDTEYKAVKSKK